MKLLSFPHWNPRWTLFEDEHILVVDKPPGMPSQSAVPDMPDDVVCRLERWFRARGEHAYVGVHHRLDQATSGLMVFARSREANGPLARAFETHAVRKTYVAEVATWAGGARTLEHRLDKDKGGLVRVVLGAKGKVAVTHVTKRTKTPSGILLELELETGRTHQARVQLASAGSPIVGDALYGGAPAPRLKLHATKLVFPHPISGKRVEFASEPRFLDPSPLESGEAFDLALERACSRRYALAHSQGARKTTAFRLVNGEGDGFPDLAIDYYDGFVFVQYYGEDTPFASREGRQRVRDGSMRAGARGLYETVRPKVMSHVSPERARTLSPSEPACGEPVPQGFAIFEEGAPYPVRLGEGFSTGIFLDQRDNRLRVRQLASEKRVLNLFSYTGAFALAALSGGAKQVVNVDLSDKSLLRGREASGMDPRAAWIAEDVFSFLKRTAQRRETFDLALCDPPSFSRGSHGTFSMEDDYGHLASSVLAILARGGAALFCTNHRKTSRARFRKVLYAAVRASGRSARQVKDLPDPKDFPFPMGRECHLKSVLVTLE